MAIILLVRHGENNWVKEHRLAGWTPGVVLNEKGHDQAKAQAERLSKLPITTIYSSPLERCMETAQHLAAPHKLGVRLFPEMGEVRYGEWEGEPISELAKLKEWHTIQHVPSRFEFPDGESLRGVQTRAVNAIECLAEKHSDEIVIVVSHADVIKLTLAHYLGMHIDLFQRIIVSPASVSALALGKGSVRVLRINDDGPLQPPPKREEKQEGSGATPAAEKA